MNKLFSKIATLSVGLAMAIGVGVAIGNHNEYAHNAEPVYAADGDTHDFSQGWSKLLNNNATISPVNIAQQSYSVKKVSIRYRYNNTITDAVTIDVSVGGNSWGTFNVNGTGSNYLVQDFTGAETKGAVDITFTNNTGSGTGHGTFYVDKITLTEGLGKTLSSIALSGSYSTNFEQGDDFSHAGMVVTATYSDSTQEVVTSAATFSGYDMSVAGDQTVTVSYTSGGVTKTATYTIHVATSTVYTVGGTITNGSLSSTASVKPGNPLNININADNKYNRPESLTVTMGGSPLTAGTGYTYNSSTGAFSIASVTGNVVINGTCGKSTGAWADLPYTVDQAFAAIDAGTGVNDVYATGIVSQILYAYTENNGVSFYMSTGGSTSGNQLEAYKCTGTYADTVSVGDTVVVHGNLTKYNSTYEFSAGCTISSLVSGQKYTVSFNGNGGTGDMASVPNQAGDYTLPSVGFTAPSGKAFAGWKAGNAGDLIKTGEKYFLTADVTFFAQWVNVYTVTYVAGENGTGTSVHADKPAGDYELLPFSGLTGISAAEGYKFKNYTVGGVEKNPGDVITLNANTTVTVNFKVKPLESTYDFVANFASYTTSGWSSSYATHTLDGVSQLGGDYGATIDLYFSSKQAQDSAIPDRPVFATKTDSENPSLYVPIIKLTLNASGLKIKEVAIEFEQWGSKSTGVALYKGANSTGDQLDTATIGTKNTLGTSNLNDTVFTVGYNNPTSSNIQVGLNSIYISLEAVSPYGTTDHIKVTSLPDILTYHVGEIYDSTGLCVMAYDNADESKANFKDITDDVLTGFTSGVYEFSDINVPSTDMFVEYEDEDHNIFHADSITFTVYALNEYELVTEAPTDWTGNYIIVDPDKNGDLVALNGVLTNVDVEGNHKATPEKSTGVIETGQELEFAISAIEGGYSVRGQNGKYIGSASSKDNALTMSDTPLVNTITFDGGNVLIAGTGGRQLGINTNGKGRFRYYEYGGVKLYKLVESSTASTYADAFINALTKGENPVCKADGSSNIASIKAAWASLAEQYAALSNSDKEQFRLGVASESGSNIQKALALYDYIAAKYNTQLESVSLDDYDFMNRGVEPATSGRAMSFDINSGSSINTTLIIILAIAGAVSLGGIIVLRKRKHQ